MGEWEKRIRKLLDEETNKLFDIEKWMNEPLPAVDNKTPREIIDSGKGEELYNMLLSLEGGFI